MTASPVSLLEVSPGQQGLDQVEASLVKLTALLASGDPQQLEAACKALHAAITAFAQVYQHRQRATPADTALGLRLQGLSVRLRQERANIARWAALVDVNLQSMLPARPAATYGRSLGMASLRSGRAGAATSYLA